MSASEAPALRAIVLGITIGFAGRAGTPATVPVSSRLAQRQVP